MGGLLSGLFASGAIGGSSAKTDRSNQLQSYTNLKNIFNWALPFAKSTAASGQREVSAGEGDLGTAAGYLKSLVQGGRASTNAAIAPEVTAVEAARDAAKRSAEASGTARGGGMAAVNQERDAQAQAAIDQAMFGVRPAAARELAQVGQAEGGLGLGETKTGLESAQIGERSAADLGELAHYNRAQSEKIHRDAVDSITKGIDETLSAVMGAL